MQDEGVGANVGGDHEPAAVHLLPQSPDVNGQGGQVTAGRDEHISQQDGSAEVQSDKSTGSCAERKRK